jgi:hypothetical protein
MSRRAHGQTRTSWPSCRPATLRSCSPTLRARPDSPTSTSRPPVEALVRVESLLREAIEGHAAHVFSKGGDALLPVFARATDGLAGGRGSTAHAAPRGMGETGGRRASASSRMSARTAVVGALRSAKGSSAPTRASSNLARVSAVRPSQPRACTASSPPRRRQHLDIGEAAGAECLVAGAAVLLTCRGRLRHFTFPAMPGGDPLPRPVRDER